MTSPLLPYALTFAIMERIRCMDVHRNTRVQPK